MRDLIDIQAAIEALSRNINRMEALPSVEPDCKGCKYCGAYRAIKCDNCARLRPDNWTAEGEE